MPCVQYIPHLSKNDKRVYTRYHNTYTFLNAHAVCFILIVNINDFYTLESGETVDYLQLIPLVACDYRWGGRKRCASLGFCCALLTFDDFFFFKYVRQFFRTIHTYCNNTIYILCNYIIVPRYLDNYKNFINMNRHRVDVLEQYIHHLLRLIYRRTFLQITSKSRLMFDYI